MLFFTIVESIFTHLCHLGYNLGDMCHILAKHVDDLRAKCEWNETCHSVKPRVSKSQPKMLSQYYSTRGKKYHVEKFQADATLCSEIDNNSSLAQNSLWEHHDIYKNKYYPLKHKNKHAILQFVWT